MHQRLLRWLDASLANRLSATLIALALGLMALAGGINFAYLFNLTHQYAQHDLEEHVRDISLSLEQGLGGIADHCRMLSENPTVVSTVLDAHSQETYLYPLLQRSRRQDHKPRNVCVTDYKGHALACLQSPHPSYIGNQQLDQAIAEGKALARIVRDGNGKAMLLFVYPIIYEGTGTAEGAVISEFELVDTLLGFIAAAEQGRDFDHVHFADAQGELHSTGSVDETISQSKLLKLSGPLSGLDLTLTLGFASSKFHAPLYRLTAAYALSAILLALLAYYLVGKIVPPLTRRIEKLTTQADRVAAGDALDFDNEDQSTDEIGRMSRSFATMTYLLRRTNESLEQKVRERTAELQEQKAYSDALFRHSHIPLVVMDPDSGIFVDCNQAAVDIYRLGSRENILGKTPMEVSAPTQYDDTPSQIAAAAHLKTVKEKGLDIFEWRHQRPNGEIWDAEVRLLAFRFGGNELWQFSLRDITEQKRSSEEIWHRANFDPLTGLANRGLCLDRLDRAIAHARRSGNRVGVLFIDLDGFKEVNDSLGHAAGDAMLTEAAQRLERCVREQDTTSRMGGDEFVLVVHDLPDRNDLLRVAAKVVAVLGEPFTLGETTRQITGSVGIAVFPDDADDATTLLADADQALYQSKRTGKNRYCFFTAAAKI